MIGPEFSSTFVEQLGELFRWRRDVRHFQTRPLDEGMVDSLLGQASLAPSVGNSQPWRFVRVLSPDRKQAVIDHVDAENLLAAQQYSSQRRQQYDALKLHGLREAPEHLAVFCEDDTPTGHGLGRRTMPQTLIYSTVVAIHALCLAARARQIGIGWVSILDPAAVVQVLDVPEQWQLIAYLCLGHPAEDHDVPELERRGWQARIGPRLTRFTR